MSTDKIIYKIMNRKTGREEGAYSRAYHTEYEFDSLEDAENSNCHGIFKNKVKYKISKYRITYELIEDDLNKPSDAEIEEDIKKEQEHNKRIEKGRKLGLSGMGLYAFTIGEILDNLIIEIFGGKNA